MKKLKIVLIVFLISNLSLTAQNKHTKTADKHFDNLKFIEAIKAYTELTKNGNANEYVYTKLAETNYNIFNTIEAEKWYAKALETSKDEEVIYNYSQMLKANGKYEDSKKWMQKFAELKPKDDRAVAFKSNDDYIPGILTGIREYEIKNLDFNSEASDFGGTIKEGVLYFSSARNNERKNYEWNDQPFLDIYQVSNTGNAEAKALTGDINTAHHEGLVSFSPDGNTMYFSSESFFDGVYKQTTARMVKTRKSVLHLFRASKVGDSWKNVKALPFNNDSYSVKNPSVSANGKTLYFASDKPGGQGKYDIYKASIKADGTYGPPENLGDKINTEGQDMFPFISNDGTLYFSSNGHLGIGGLDIFHTTASGDVINAGIPVNSNADDLAFSINDETGEGFVSSNREGGKGSDDIYAIKKLEPCLVSVTTTVIDNVSSNLITGAIVTIKDEKGQVVAKETANSKGEVTYTVPCDNTLNITAAFNDYESNTVDFSGSREKEHPLKVTLKPIEKIIVEDRVVLNPILFDSNKSNITAQGAFELDKLVSIMNKYPDMVILTESHTDSKGKATYNENLSNRRAQSSVQYVISKGINSSRITGVGKGETELKIDCGTNCTEEELQINRRSEFIILSGGPKRNK